MPLLFFLSFLIFGAGVAGLVTPFSAPPEPVETITVNPCYQLEGTKITLNSSWLITDDCRTTLENHSYLRLRQQVGIVDAKISEGQGAHPSGDCGASYYGSLRKVGSLPAGAGPYNEAKDIYWESENYLHDDLTNFLLINTEKKEGKHYFDVYIDENEKDNLATDSKYEFIRNCQETGGLVPVVEGPTTPTFPPQAISLTDDDFNNLANQRFDKDGSPYSDNFDNYNDPNIFGFEGKYFIRIDPPAGEKVEVDRNFASQIGFFSKTISGETRTYEVWFHSGTVYLYDPAPEDQFYRYLKSDTKPPFAVSRDPTLQLAALKFITVSEWTWATPECKPALYLYPEKPTRLRVVLKPAGKLTVTNPQYDEEKGWEVVTYPDGTIYNSYNNYSYLYYEAEIEKVKTPKQGWVVSKGSLETLFDEILPTLGLNQSESLEFKSYWLSVLNGSPYYFIGVIDRQELERIEPIEFSQKPDTFIRVRLFFEPLEKLVAVDSPTLPPTPNRQGFVAVDWGGILSSGTCQAGKAINSLSQ